MGFWTHRTPRTLRGPLRSGYFDIMFAQAGVDLSDVVSGDPSAIVTSQLNLQ